MFGGLDPDDVISTSPQNKLNFSCSLLTALIRIVLNSTIQ